MLRDVVSQTVRRWREGPDRGDVNALIKALDTTLSPAVVLFAIAQLGGAAPEAISPAPEPAAAESAQVA